MLPTETMDTRQLVPADRFPFWLDMAARVSAPIALHSDHAADFTGWAQIVDLGSLQLTRFRYQSLIGRRTLRMIRQFDPEVYQLALTTAGRGAISQDRRTTTLSYEFIFLDWSRPHELSHFSADGRDLATSVTVVIPRALLPLSADKIARLAAVPMSGTTGMGALLAQHVSQVTRYPEQYRPADAPRLATVTLDLVSALLARHIDAEDTLPVDVRQGALLARVHAFIDRHLGDVTLTPQTVADAHHISVRALHRLFEHEPDTIAGSIRSRRLERCRRDLADPRLGNQPVHAIAARYGFTDKAHFSRAFRAAYGLSPRSYRLLSTSAASGADRQPPGTARQQPDDILVTRQPDRATS